MKQKNEKKVISENTKRVLSAIILIPAVAALLIFGNVYTFDIALAIISIVALKEYNDAVSKVCKPIRNIGYIVAILTFALHLLISTSIEYVSTKATMNYIIQLSLVLNILLVFFIAIAVIVCIMYSFIKLIKNNMQTDLKDIVYTIFGIIYVIGFIISLAMIYSIIPGKYLIWYVFLIAWGTDIMAYAIGRRYGKHKFTAISPNKSIEGSISGILGGIIFAILYTVVLTKCFDLNISYLYVIIMSLILSIFGQIGDLVASAIKRHVDIKDFGKIVPGHGGILDRLDSIIFMAPAAYILLMLIR